jgi:hypothetical protein
MTDTPNHNYKIPTEGSEDWHIPLNENFENLDIDVEIRDTEQNKNQYEPKKGAKYEATDSGAIYYGSGDTWALVKRKVSSLTTDELNHGQIIVETPNGHWERFDDLITATKSAPNYSTVYVYGGVTIDEPIVYEDSWSHWGLVGLGDRVSSINASSSFNGDTMIDFSGSNVINRWGRIENIQFNGQNNVSTGIQIHQAQGGLLRNVHVDNVNGIGIDLDNNAYDNNLWRVEVQYTGDVGINIGDANEVTLFNCLVRSTGSHNVQMGETGANLVGARIIGSRFRSPGPENDGIRIENQWRCYGNMILGCHFEAEMDIGINYAPTNKGSKGGAWVANCRFNGQDTASIQTRNKAADWVVGPSNRFADNGSGLDFGHNTFSSNSSVTFFNAVSNSDKMNPFTNADVTVLEPGIDLFQFPGSTVFKKSLRSSNPQDLSTTMGSDPSEVRQHNGNDGSTEGLYEWTGTDWVGIGRASGTTITPS